MASHRLLAGRGSPRRSLEDQEEGRRLPERAARPRVPDHLLRLRDRFVTAAGEIATVRVEQEEDPRKIDHVWIQLRAGEVGRVQISLSTCSRQSRAAGFDPRVRVGIIHSTWTELPPRGVRLAPPLDYALLESARPVLYQTLDRAALEHLLVTKARRAIYLEAWGEFYFRAHMGVHQIHSCRGSFAVPRDLIGRDGAVQFYFREPDTRELLLFKVAGQL